MRLCRMCDPVDPLNICRLLFLAFLNSDSVATALARLVISIMQQRSLTAPLLDPQGTSASSDHSRSVGDQPAKPKPFIVQWFISHFDDKHSRLAFVLAFLLALAVSCYWLQYTIVHRWQYSLDHPLQTISFETVDQLPAILAIELKSAEQFLPIEATYMQRVIPLLISESYGYIPNPDIACTNQDFNGPSVLCQQVNSQGKPVVDVTNAPAGELDGSYADHIDAGAFPLQYRMIDGVLSQSACFSVQVLVNSSAIDLTSSQRDFPPTFVLLSLGLTSLLSQLELIAHGHTAPNDTLVAQWGTRDPATKLVGFVGFSRSSIFQFDTTITYSLDSSLPPSYSYSYQQYADAARGEAAQARDWALLLNATTNATERARLESLYADPTVSHLTNFMCLQPHSANVQVIRLQTLYGFTSFLSDAGQRAAGHSDGNRVQPSFLISLACLSSLLFLRRLSQHSVDRDVRAVPRDLRDHAAAIVPASLAADPLETERQSGAAHRGEEQRQPVER